MTPDERAWKAFVAARLQGIIPYRDFMVGWNVREAEIPKAAEGWEEAWERYRADRPGVKPPWWPDVKIGFRAAWEAAMAAVWQKLQAGPAEEQGAGQPGEDRVTVPAADLRAVLDQEPRDPEGMLRCDACGAVGVLHDVAAGAEPYYLDHASDCPRLRLRRALEPPGFEHQAPEIRHVVHEEPRTGGGTTVYHLEQKTLDKIREELDIDGLAEAVQRLELRVEALRVGAEGRAKILRHQAERITKLEEAAGHHDALRDRVAILENRVDILVARMDAHQVALESLQRAPAVEAPIAEEAGR